MTRTEVVRSMFEAIQRGDIEGWRGHWHESAIWHLEDRNDWGGDLSLDAYLEGLGRFIAQYGAGYDFRIDDIREQGELVVVFCRSKQPELGETDGIMVYRVRDNKIVEGWGIGRGSDSTNPW